jgi:hypothetical protein
MFDGEVARRYFFTAAVPQLPPGEALRVKSDRACPQNKCPLLLLICRLYTRAADAARCAQASALCADMRVPADAMKAANMRDANMRRPLTVMRDAPAAKKPS